MVPGEGTGECSLLHRQTTYNCKLLTYNVSSVRRSTRSRQRRRRLIEVEDGGSCDVVEQARRRRRR